MPGIADDLFHEYGVLNGEAAQEVVESAQHIPQHSNGAEPTEICHRCHGERVVALPGGGCFSKVRCPKCKGDGKLRHC